MLTIKKIKIYNKFGGDIDGFSRGRKMSQQNLFNDNDWSLIDEFEQDIKLISDRVVSKEYREKALIKLNKNCDLETKEYFKSKIPFYSDFKEVSIIVANIKLRINDETDTVWAGFENTEALIKELDYDKKQIELLDFDTLEKWIREMYSPIENKNLPHPNANNVTPYGKDALSKILYVVPVREENFL